MKLPQNALILISKYSKPLTHPNWKILKKFTQYEYSKLLYNESLNTLIYDKPIYTEHNNLIICVDFIIKIGQIFKYNKNSDECQFLFDELRSIF